MSNSRYYNNSESKDFGYFLQGTYWVYQNDSTFQTDSIAVIYSESILGGAPPKTVDGCVWEVYYIETESSSCSANTKGETAKYTIYNNRITLFVDDNTNSIYHLQEFVDLAGGIHHDTLTLNGYTYYDIYEKVYDASQAYDFFSDDCIFYIARNFGIIKKEITDTATGYTESWTLLRYHINQ